MLNLSLPDRAAAAASRRRTLRPDSSTPHALATLMKAEGVLRKAARELETATRSARRSTDRMLDLALHPGSARHPRLDLMTRVVEVRSARVQRLLTDIEDLAAIRADRFELSCQRVNLVPLVSRIVSRTRTAKYPLQFGAPQGLTVSGDADRLSNVVQSLIEQAQRRNPRGCWIDVDLRRPLTGQAQLAVRDYGRRLSSTEREQLPDEETPDRQWYLCEEVVAHHGGTLAIEMPEEGGLRVIATLPTTGPHARG